MSDLYLDLEYLNVLYAILDKVEFSLLIADSNNVVIAGGAIRDMLLKKPISDIDVFYKGALSDTKLKTYFDSSEILPDFGYPEGVTVTHKVTLKNLPVPIQLIKVEDIDIHINSFPSEMIRVSYRIKTGLQGFTPSFVDSFKHKTFWWDKEVDLKYFSKIKAKYSDWKHMFVDPAHNPEKQGTMELTF